MLRASTLAGKMFGIHVTLIEPGGFSTDWSGSSSVQVQPGPEYAFLVEALKARRSQLPQGDPTATQKAILTLVDSPNPPLRLFLGSSPLGIARHAYEQRLNTWEQWSEVSDEAQGNK
jgi:hypothetical protein